MNNKLLAALIVSIAVISLIDTAQASRPGNPRSYEPDVLLEVFKLTQADSDVPFDSLMQACPARDCIPSIDKPDFIPAGEVEYLRVDDLELSLRLRASGEVDASLDGEQITIHRMYWFAWYSFHPSTALIDGKDL